MLPFQLAPFGLMPALFQEQIKIGSSSSYLHQE